MSADIELNIFTNSTKFAPDTTVIERTYESFIDTFGKVQRVNVWHDPKPNSASADTYHQELQRLFPQVNRTISLADGYKKAILGSTSEFIFMLEHDWEFVGDSIAHGLAEICQQMGADDILHLRFNKIVNRCTGWDVDLIERSNGIVPYCVTPCISNNPHIIQRAKYLDEALRHIRVSENGASGGIEDRLLRAKNLYGAIYGTLEHPACVSHLDGRKNEENTGLLARLRTRVDVRNWINIRYARNKIRHYSQNLQ